MTSTDVAIIDHDNGQIIPAGGTVPVSLPTGPEFVMMETWAKSMANSGIMPKHLSGRWQAVMTVMLYGRELRLPPMTAIANVYVIDQRPSLAAHLQRAIILRAGHDIYLIESTDKTATFGGRRRGVDGQMGPEQRLTWTIEMAERAKLIGKDNWKLYPDAMLRARASSALARLIFPDILMGGVYTPEELGATVDKREGVTALPTPKQARQAIAAAEQTSQQVQVAQNREGDPEPAFIVDPAAPLDLPDPSEAPTEPVPDAAPPVPQRAQLWAEVCNQARIMGRTLTQYTARWKAGHNQRDISMATNAELLDFVAVHREQISEHLSNNPEEANNEHRTPMEDVETCPPDPDEEKD